MAVVREPHHHRPCWRVIIEGMDAEVIPLPQAPDAIELRHLRSFVAVADELNFGRAAARLYVSQPALSRQVSSLERLVGCELLRRSTHRVELTLAGEALLGRARELLQNLDEAVSVTRSVGGELLARANRHWELAGLGSEVSGPGQDLQELRDAVEALHGTSDGLRRIRPGVEKFDVPLTGQELATEPREVRWLFVLAPDDRPGIRLEPLEGMGRLEVLLRNTYRLGLVDALAMQAQHLASCGRLARSVEMALVRWPHRGSEPRQVVDRLLSEVGRCNRSA